MFLKVRLIVLRTKFAISLGSMVLAYIATSPTTIFASPIYVINRPDGSITFTSKAPSNGVQAKIFTAEGRGFSYYRSRFSRLGSYARRPNRELSLKYLTMIQSAARLHGLNPHLITALVHVESAFNPRATSPKGAMGLTQLMPATARMLGVKTPYDPHENLNGGVKFLAHLLKKYKGNFKLSLAAYNAGEDAVDKYRGIPPYLETQNYVRNVLFLFSAYARLPR